MKFFNTLLLAGLSATSVLANGAAIIKDLSTITNDTNALDKTLVTFTAKPGLLQALPILSASGNLQDAIDAGTKTATNSAPLTVDEAVQVAGAVNTLSQAVNVTLTDFIKAKPGFDKSFLTGIAKNQLSTTKTKSDALSNAIVAKVPASLQPAASQIAAGIDASFAQALAVYA